MADRELLLTVVLEAPEPLDKESKLYRRLLETRLHWETQYQITVVEHEVTTAVLNELCASRPSKYIVVINQSHQVSPNYMRALLEHLDSTTAYLAEPYKYQSAIPTKIRNTKLDTQYTYGQDIDIHGIAFNTGRTADMLDALGDLDRTSLHLAYRLYWSIEVNEPIQAGYSTASDTKAAIGYTPNSNPARLLPLIRTKSQTLRIRILRQLILFLRGLREQPESNVPITHLRAVVKTFNLTSILELATQMHSFECAWVRWLADDESKPQLYKQLTTSNIHLSFVTEPAGALSLECQDGPTNHTTTPPMNNDTEVDVQMRVLLKRVRLGRETLRVEKLYVNKPNFDFTPENYDFYGRPITANSIILFFDRPLQADDNAEYLYDHFRKTRPEYTRSYFALNPKSPDWNRLKQKGFNLIEMFSKEFYELFLRSDLVVSSQIFNLKYQGKTFANSRFVYLQHGIQLNDMSNWVASKHFDIFVATGKSEADYLRSVAPMETLNSGLPRLESLTTSDSADSQILFMPTWRFDLHQSSPEQFRESLYFKALNSVLTDQRLIDFLKSTHTTLQVKLHPNVEKRSHHFDFSSHVQRSRASYRQAISEASFVFTDYSSAVLDAAFISTPIAYYQWDRDHFFEGQLYKSRIDYASHGLGPVFQNHDAIIDYIVSRKYTEPNAEFLRRSVSFFEGVDVDTINETIIDRMLRL